MSDNIFPKMLSTATKSVLRTRMVPQIGVITNRPVKKYRLSVTLDIGDYEILPSAQNDNWCCFSFWYNHRHYLGVQAEDQRLKAVTHNCLTFCLITPKSLRPSAYIPE